METKNNSKSFSKVILLISIYLSLITYAFAQESEIWMQNYRLSKECSGKSLVETYDQGYLLAGRLKLNSPSFSYLLKVDKNGNKLWQKTIGDKSGNCFALQKITTDKNGYIYISSLYDGIDGIGDPCIIKLSPCGEKLWSKVFYTKNNYDSGRDIKIQKNGDILFTMTYTKGPMHDRICVVRISPEGEIINKIYYARSDSRIYNEEPFDLIILEDGKTLMSGYCDIMDTDEILHLKGFFICTQENGEVLWEKVIDKDVMGELGSWHQYYASTLSSDGKYLYSAGNRRFAPEITPNLLKLNLETQEYEFYEMQRGFEYGDCRDIELATDSTLIASAGWTRPISVTERQADKKSDLRYKKQNANLSYHRNNVLSQSEVKEKFKRAVLLDTLGNVKKSIGLTSWFSHTILRTSDNHFLFFTFMHPDEEPEPSAYLYKFDQELNWAKQDLTPTEYDYYCDQPIQNDTLYMEDYDIITDLPELEENKPELSIYPNPVNNLLHIKLPDYIKVSHSSELMKITQYNYQYKRNSSIKILNLQGVVIYQKNISGEDALRLDTRSYKTGLYIIQLIEG
ncbi:MAG: T9SS type A sorting domain-containing protein, partial [Hyphomicrobiales bacterium]